MRGSSAMKQETEGERERERERERENRFPFSGARLPPGALLVPRQTARWLLFFPPLSFPAFIRARSTSLVPSPKLVYHVLFRSRDQHCYGSVVRPVLRSGTRHRSRFRPISRILVDRNDFFSFLIMLIVFLIPCPFVFPCVQNVFEFK